MAALAAAAFTALSSTFTATAGTAAAAGTVATGAPLSLTAGAAGAASSAAGFLGGSASWLSALQLGLGGLSALATAGAGQEKSDQLLSAANDANSQAINEQIVGTERRASLKRQAADAASERAAAYAAGGVDLSFGTPAIAQAQDVRDAEHALAIDQGTQDQRVARLNERAGQFRSAAKSSRQSSLLRAFLQGGETLLSTQRRGVFS